MKTKLQALLTFLIWLLLLALVVTTGQEVRDKRLAAQKAEKVKKEETIVYPSKSQAKKQAVMKADVSVMDAYGLYYDYAHMTLPEVVQAFMDEYGIGHEQVAFSYKNLKTGEMIGMNDLQPMTAGSTYKLPLNMLVVDGVADKKFSMDKAYDISQVDYENATEYEAYRQQFGDDMTISEMQEYSLVYSENTPAHGLAQMLGGFEKAYQQMQRYGKSKADIKTIDLASGNKTTTDYYIQVLDYLYQHQDKYKDILYYIGISFPDQYYKTFWPELTIYQKPGYVGEALNVGAIVYEETPYLIALYTAGLGGSTPEDLEVNGYGYYQLTLLTYVINEWHRVNQNP